MTRSYAPQVIADGSGRWTGNQLRFPTEAEALAYVHDLMMRWVLVTDTRAMPTDDPATDRFLDGRLSKVMPVSVLDLAQFILNRGDDEALDGADFDACDLPIFGGCQGCEAGIAAYNAYPSRTGYLRCRGCIEDLGWMTVQEALEALFAPGGVLAD